MLILWHNKISPFSIELSWCHVSICVCGNSRLIGLFWSVWRKRGVWVIWFCLKRCMLPFYNMKWIANLHSWLGWEDCSTIWAPGDAPCCSGPDATGMAAVEELRFKAAQRPVEQVYTQAPRVSIVSMQRDASGAQRWGSWHHQMYCSIRLDGTKYETKVGTLEKSYEKIHFHTSEPLMQVWVLQRLHFLCSFIVFPSIS